MLRYYIFVIVMGKVKNSMATSASSSSPSTTMSKKKEGKQSNGSAVVADPRKPHSASAKFVSLVIITCSLLSFIAGILTPPLLNLWLYHNTGGSTYYTGARQKTKTKTTKDPLPHSRNGSRNDISPPKFTPYTKQEEAKPKPKKVAARKDKKKIYNGCTNDKLKGFLHDTYLNGYHVICSNPSTSSKETYYFHGSNKHSNVTLDGLSNSNSLLTYRTLHKSFFQKIRLSSNKKEKWAVFSETGKLLYKYDSLSSDSSFLDRPLMRDEMLIFIEGGTWFWPPVEIGFKRSIDLNALEQPSISSSKNNTVTLETLSVKPIVLSVQGFLSGEECSHVREKASKFIKHSSGVSNMDHDQGKDASEWRTSKSTFLSSRGNQILKDIEIRTAKLTRIPKNHQEDTQVLKYEIGQKYDAHHDFFDVKLYQKDKYTLQLTKNGEVNRFATVFWYLSDVAEGGETIFPRFNGAPPIYDYSRCDYDTALKVKPEKGKVIIFYSLRPNGELDQYSLHGACPVINGTKGE